MTNTKAIILKLKEVREEKGYSYTDIINMMEKNGDYLSKATLSRLFGKKSEDLSFKYDETIRPVAKALLDIETYEEDDTLDVQAMKTLLKYKIQRIEELEQMLDKEKIKSKDKLLETQKEYQTRFDFLNNQIALKDKRIDNLLETTTKLLTQILDCPCRMKHEN